MSHVFISYSTQNSQYANQLAAKLRQEGFDVWIDNSKLRSSDNWWESIVRALRGCAAVVVVMTPESKASKWVQREVTLADNWQKPTFPVLLAGENWEIYVLTQFENVRQGRLPGTEFYDKLAEYSPRKAQPGVDLVRQSSTQPILHGDDDDTELRREIANPPPIDTGAVPITPDLTINKTITVPAPRRFDLRLLLGAFVVVVLALIALLLNNQQNTNNQLETLMGVTQTSAQQIADLSTRLTSTNTLAEETATSEPTFELDIIDTRYNSKTRELIFGISAYRLVPDVNIAKYRIEAIFFTPDGHANNAGTSISFINSTTPASIFLPDVYLGKYDIVVHALDADNNELVSYTESYELLPTATPTVTPSPTPSRTVTPSVTPTVDIAMAVATLDTQATIDVGSTNAAATATSAAVQTVTAASWTDTPTPNLTASIEAFLTLRTAQTATAIAAFQTATADTWTDTPTPTSTATATPTATSTPTSTPTPLGGGAGQIAFSSNRDGDSELFVVDTNGKNLRQLTNNNYDDDRPSWSPDGQKIAFNSNRDGHWEIYVMDADGSNLRRLTQTDSSLVNLNPAWSPDGSKVAYYSNPDGNADIYVLDLATGVTNRLMSNLSADFNPSWSADGTRITFYSTRDGGMREIYVMDADGSNQVRMTDNDTVDLNPVWSPDGSRIVFESLFGEYREIQVMNADGSNILRLTNNTYNDGSPAWSPDGNWIIYSTNEFGKSQIAVMDADGNNRQRVTHDDLTNGSPAWRPLVTGEDVLANVAVATVEVITTEEALATPEVTAEMPLATEEATQDTFIAEIMLDPGSNLKMRRQPNTSAEVLALIPAGTQVIVISRTEDSRWLHVIYEGLQGWIAAGSDNASFARVTLNGTLADIKSVQVDQQN